MKHVLCALYGIKGHIVLNVEHSKKFEVGQQVEFNDKNYEVYKVDPEDPYDMPFPSQNVYVKEE